MSTQMNTLIKHTAVLWLVCVGTAVAAEESIPANTEDFRAFERTFQSESDRRWEISIGAVYMHEPVSPGVDKSESQVLPYIDILYRQRFFLNTRNGLGCWLTNRDEEGLFGESRVGIAIDYEDERDASDLGSERNLNLLGDLDSTINGVLFAEVELGAFEIGWEFGKAITTDAHDGWYSEFQIELGWEPWERMRLSFEAGLRYSSDAYQQAYYGVNPTQAAATGLAEYSPDSGMESYFFGLMMRYRLFGDWTLLVMPEYEKLTGDAKDSPIVNKEGQMSWIVGIAYSF